MEDWEWYQGCLSRLGNDTARNTYRICWGKLKRLWQAIEYSSEDATNAEDSRDSLWRARNGDSTRTTREIPRETFDSRRFPRYSMDGFHGKWIGMKMSVISVAISSAGRDGKNRRESDQTGEYKFQSLFRSAERSSNEWINKFINK